MIATWILVLITHLTPALGQSPEGIGHFVDVIANFHTVEECREAGDEIRKMQPKVVYACVKQSRKD